MFLSFLKRLIAKFRRTPFPHINLEDITHQFKLQRQFYDDRDLLFDYKELMGAKALPQDFDIRDKCPPVYDQGNEGSCTANAGCACRSMLNNDQSLYLSRAFLYYQERALENHTNEDSGATMRDICKATNKFGICHDAEMPYSAGQFTVKPSAAATTDAVKYKISAYKSIPNLNGIKTALVTRNQPVLIGMTVYESMESADVTKSGILPMPKSGERQLGGHAVLAVGYHDNPTAKCGLKTLLSGESKGYLIMRNSWGEGWGQSGYFFMPYEYFSKYTYDYWIMEN